MTKKRRGRSVFEMYIEKWEIRGYIVVICHWFSSSLNARHKCRGAFTRLGIHVSLVDKLLAALVAGRSVDDFFWSRCPPTVRLAGLTECSSVLTHCFVG